MKRILTLGLAGLAVCAAAAGCGTGSTTRADAPATTTSTDRPAQALPGTPLPGTPLAGAPRPTTPTSSAPRTATPSQTSAAAPAPGSNSGSAPGSGCPATTDVLFTALKSGTGGMYSRSGNPAALRDPVCYAGFASAGTIVDENHQPSRVLFGYDAASRHWTPLTVGSAHYCEGFTPEDVAAHLPGCGG
ncbi:hypothetical protein Lfu02_76440 [Longispora fulva]|uniref:Uncharacterized protein n=1 Tax=Longispora fulva TaxID=619741 RepID=A0A8J7KKR1_9ACTN|nr:hypothetical protein [Longispora fulva]MBG6138424.1 hypothetical protein [Longispora fulva]GIG63272.1 hypothetical protein Lfu02_76440 [Longispora fulva]